MAAPSSRARSLSIAGVIPISDTHSLSYLEQQYQVQGTLRSSKRNFVLSEKLLDASLEL